MSEVTEFINNCDLDQTESQIKQAFKNPVTKLTRDNITLKNAVRKFVKKLDVSLVNQHVLDN